MQEKTIFNFDNNGNLLPYGKSTIDIGFFYSFFVANFDNSTTRKEIFNNYIRYIEDLFALLEFDSFTQYIGGSFLTNKQNPSDIDVVNLIHFHFLHMAGEEKRKILFNNFLRRHEIGNMKSQGKSNELYNVDAFLIPIFPKNDPRSNSESLSRIKTWQNTFNTHDKDNFPRGFVQIIYDKKMLQELKKLRTK